MNSVEYQIENHLTKMIDVNEKLSNKWRVWLQNCYVNNLQMPSINQYITFDSIIGMWTVLNNLNIPENANITFARDLCDPFASKPYIINIDERWHTDRCTDRCTDDCTNHFEIFQKCLLGILGETFTIIEYDPFNITGISYIPNFKQLIIWTKDEILDINKISLEYRMLMNNE